jgi:hypothetical protein
MIKYKKITEDKRLTKRMQKYKFVDIAENMGVSRGWIYSVYNGAIISEKVREKLIKTLDSMSKKV